MLASGCSDLGNPRYDSLPQLETVVLQQTWPEGVYLADPMPDAPFYLERIPENPKGLIVVLPAGGENPDSVAAHLLMDEEGARHGWAVIYPSINWGCFHPEASVALLDVCIANCLSRHSIPSDQVAIGGLSNGGAIALEYGIRSEEEGATEVRPRMLFVLDTMLDYARAFRYTEGELKFNPNGIGAGEAAFIQGELLAINGGPPDLVPAAYDSTSIYSPRLDDGGRCKALMGIPLRMFSDMDLEWLFNERQRDLYDWNGTDLIAMANTLKRNGHQDVYMHVSQGRGERPDGTRHPHSWNIMWHGEVVGWLDDNLPSE